MQIRERAMKKIVIVVLLILLAVPVYAATTPDWINGISTKYPQKDYLIGVGIGDTIDSARSSARAEIAKVFKARIVQFGQETKSEKTSLIGSSSQFMTTQDTALSTAVSTDELLQGVEIAETWVQKKNKTYYALAVLNKQKTRQALMQQIVDQEEIVVGKLAQAKSGGSIIDKLRALHGALDATDKKDELITRKRVLDPVAVADISVGSTRADIERQKAGLIAKVRFVIQADDTPNLAARVAEKVTALGFITVPTATDAKEPDAVVLTVSAKTTAYPVDRGNPRWIFFAWRGTLTISDAADTGRVVATVVKEGQASHLTSEAAREKAVAEAAQAVATAVEQELVKYLFGK